MDKVGKRYAAGTISLQGGSGGILAMCSCRDFMEVYKKDKTFRVETPESIDPDELDLDMGFTVKEIKGVGCANQIIARLMVQSNDAMRIMAVDEDKKILVMSSLCECKDLMISCEKIYNEIKNSNDEAFKILSSQKYGRVINPFPQIDNLEEHCSRFLANAKLYLRRLIDLYNIFYDEKIEEVYFNKISSELEKKYGAENIIHLLISNNHEMIKKIIDYRNRSEHPNPKLIIKNIALLPGQKIQVPIWYIEGQQSKNSIIVEMESIIEFLLEFGELFLLYCCFDRNKSWIKYKIIQIQKCERDIDCPKRFNVEIDCSCLKNYM